MSLTNIERAVVAVAAAAAVGGLLLFSGMAKAQSLCMARADLIEILSTRYAEAPISRGLASGGQMVEVFSSPDGATWTLLLTEPDGMSCMMAEGQGWSSLTQEPTGDPA